MSKKFIYEIIDELEHTPSTNDKIEILNLHKDNEELKQSFYLALNPFMKFGIKAIPEYKKDKHGVLPYIRALDDIKTHLNGTQRSKQTENTLIKILSSVSDEESIILERIIKKDLRCGVSDKTVNKVWPNLIPEFSVMLASKVTDKLLDAMPYPAYVQQKMDGMRVCMFVYPDGKYKMFSRNGNEVLDHNQFTGNIDPFRNAVLDGELLCIDKEGKYLDRKTSNGICNKSIRGTISEEEASTLIFVAWDAIPIDNVENGKATTSMPYSTRLNWLTTVMNQNPQSKIRLIENKVVDDITQVFNHFAVALDEEQEGIILKNPNSQWEPKRSKHMIKFKAEKTADLKIVGVVEGTGKYVGKLGAFLLQSEDGLLEVSVGSGFSDEQRDEYFSKNYIGDIVEVTYNETIKAKGKKLPSLFLPVFERMRPDKSVANIVEDIDKKLVNK